MRKNKFTKNATDKKTGIKNFLLFLYVGALCLESEASALNEIEFDNEHYGRITFIPLKNKEKIQNVLQSYKTNSVDLHEDDLSINEPEEKQGGLKLNLIENSYEQDSEFFEIHNVKNFFGIAEISYALDDSKVVPKISCYLLTEYQQKKLKKDINLALADYMFNSRDYEVVTTDSVASGLSSLALERLGYLKLANSNEESSLSYSENTHKLTRSDRGLSFLSQIIKEKPEKFIPKIFSMPKGNMERSGALWFAYFRKGIPLSNGGVEQSFITADDLSKCPNLQDFNMYRSDRSQSINPREEDIKNFLVHDNIFSSSTRLDELSIKFSLGGHEGFTRLARCIYRKGYNEGMLYPSGGYGFLAFAATALRPLAYEVNLIDINRENGEKILLEDLENQIKRYSKSKTLYLEQKTTAGAIYTGKELEDIILLCKKYNLFFIMDMAHIGMELNEISSFPDFVGLCQKNNFYQFASLYTGSKTYGLERARVGFIILDKNNHISHLDQIVEKDLYRVLGSIGDTPFEVTRALLNSPVEKRQQYRKYFSERRRFNMNLMLAYIEGIKSEKIDSDMRETVQQQIEPSYQKGIKGIRVLYKPEAGSHLKISTSDLTNKYFSNIRMYDSEIFSYVLNKVAGVTTLHSYQILDREGFAMRLGFSIRDHVHQGMMRIHNFISTLSDQPTINRFLPEVISIEDIIFPPSSKIKQIILNSKEEAKKLNLFEQYKENIKKQLPFYINLTDSDLELAINKAARSIQRGWRQYKNN